MNAKLKNQFSAAYDAHAEAIYRHCFFRVYSHEKAEELVQETFLRTWEYLEGGKTVENMRAFLYRVANNLVIDHVRKHKEESLERVLEKDPAAEPTFDGQKDAEKQMALKEIYEAMKDLPEDVREILTYRFVDDLDPKDIADILGITPNNVSVRLNRAIKVLQKELQ